MGDPVRDAHEAWDALEKQPRARRMRWPGAVFGFAALAVSLCFVGTVDAQVCGPTGPIFCKTSQFAFFEFAPANGAGMGTACACTTPTGAKGEAMTFTRASSGTCLKGNTTTAVANGDMVTCSTNQPRVMPGGDGSGALGLLVEASRTNVVLRSQEFENAAWTSTASGVANPTVTANAAVAPDGTTTADRVQIPATSGVQYSLLQSGSVLTATASSIAVWAKGNGTTDQTCIAASNGSGANCLCSYNPTTWTRCKCENKTLGALGPMYIGNYSASTGPCGISFNAQDVFLWQAQGETAGSPYITSDIATTSAAVTRAVDNATAAVTDQTSSTESMAVTVVPEWSGTTGPPFGVGIGMKQSAAVVSFANLDASGTAGRFYDSVTVRQANIIAGLQRWIGIRDSSAITVFYGTNTQTTSNAPPADVMTGTVCIGSDCSGSPFDGVVKQLCLSPDPSRCR